MRYGEIIQEMRPDSDEYYALDRADKWLAKYTYENLDKWPNKEVLQTLVQRYPISKPMKIYRGMNFSTKELWDEFAKEINTGSLTFGGISSWGRNNEHVEQFAVTKPSYGLNLDTMREYSASQKEMEYISGYRGVIVETIATPSTAIDVSSSKLGHEDEIILIPGTYEVKIFKELKKYKDSMTDINVDDVITSDSTSRYDKGFKDYVLHHHTDKLGDRAKHHLFVSKRAYAIELGPIDDVTLSVTKPYFEKDTTTKTIMSFHYGYFWAGANGQYTPEDNEICRKEAKRTIAKAIKIIQAHPDYTFKYVTNFGEIAKYAGNYSQFFDAVKRHIQAQYAQAEIDGREINNQKFKDAWDFDSAVRRHAERVAEILSQTP